MVSALQEAFETAPSKPENFPGTSWQTFQGVEASRKSFLCENRAQVPAYNSSILMVCKIQGTKTFGEKERKTWTDSLAREVA